MIIVGSLKSGAFCHLMPTAPKLLKLWYCENSETIVTLHSETDNLLAKHNEANYVSQYYNEMPCSYDCSDALWVRRHFQWHL